MIKNKYDDELNDNIDNIIRLIVELGDKKIYKWIKSKGIYFSLEDYDNNETFLINELENNWEDRNEFKMDYYNEFDNYYYDDYYYDDDNNISLEKSNNILEDTQKKIIIPCVKLPYRRRNKKNYYSKNIVKKVNPSIYPKSYKHLNVKSICKR